MCQWLEGQYIQPPGLAESRVDSCFNASYALACLSSGCSAATSGPQTRTRFVPVMANWNTPELSRWTPRGVTSVPAPIHRYDCTFCEVALNSAKFKGTKLYDKFDDDLTWDNLDEDHSAKPLTAFGAKDLNEAMDPWGNPYAYFNALDYANPKLAQYLVRAEPGEDY